MDISHRYRALDSYRSWGGMICKLSEMHGDEIGGLGRKAVPDEYHPSLMVGNG